jgi:prevent-host-death family protein
MLKVVNMHEAKTRLSRLVEAAERGQTVVISRNGQPAAMLVPFPHGRGPGWSKQMRQWIAGGEGVDFRIDRRDLEAPRRLRF